MNTLTSRIQSPIRREHAEQYLLITLLGFAGSVILTRVYLDLTGYPQLGNAELHIAHVLWGGLLLFIASILPLVFANRWVYIWGALLSGVGVGLFIDEVGKFITRSNDYFYPFAAPIIYAVFLLTVLLYLRVRKFRPVNVRAELYAALDGLMEVLDHDLDNEERATLDGRLSFVATHADHADLRMLANALLAFIRSDSLYIAPRKLSIIERWQARTQTIAQRFVTQRRLRFVVVGGLLALGMVTIGDLLIALVAFFSPSVLEQIAAQLLAREELVRGSMSLVWFLIRLMLEGTVGLFLVAGAALLLAGRERLGSRAGYFGLLLSLTTVNLVVLYFDQFAAIASTMIQFTVLMILLYYRHEYLTDAEAHHFSSEPADDPARFSA